MVYFIDKYLYQMNIKKLIKEEIADFFGGNIIPNQHLDGMPNYDHGILYEKILRILSKYKKSQN